MTDRTHEINKTIMKSFLLETEEHQQLVQRHKIDANLPLVVAYGGGLNSTAMLCGFRERGIIPSLILFADTGGEMPET